MQSINGKVLLTLTITELKNELNITSYGDRATIVKYISKLKKESKVKRLKEKQVIQIHRINC